MSNAKLKEQIEAAKIALVHSAEEGLYATAPPTSGTITQTPSNDTDHTQNHVDSFSKLSTSPIRSGTPRGGQDMIPQSDFEKLEARLQGLENQIKNQQRDLHTLLQKLRDITSKSQAVAKPKKSNGTKKWLAVAALCMMGFGAVYYWLGAAMIIGILYQVTGFMVSLIDTLAGKF